MNRTKQILIGGCSLVAILIVIKLSGERFAHPPKGSAEPVFKSVIRAEASNKWVALKDVKGMAFAEQLRTNADGAVYGREVQTVRMDLQTDKYRAMKQAMTETLQSLGIEPEERTVQRLVGARIKADWSEVPEHFKNAPDWAALQSLKLKRAIAKTLNTEDPLTMKRVLETDLGGPTLPPMADYELRDGPEAVYREAKAIEANK